MRRITASLSRLRPQPRLGTVLALAALVVQLVLPGAAAFAMGRDPLGAVPICTTTSHGTAPEGPRKVLHAACPLCQAPAATWGFLPPSPPVLAAPHAAGLVVWHHETAAGGPAAVVARFARGPPRAA